MATNSNIPFANTNSTTTTSTLKQPNDLSHYYSYSTKARIASKVKGFYKYMVPGIGQLAGGLPNNAYFPFDTLEAKVALPERWKPTINSTDLVEVKTEPNRQPDAHLLVPHVAPPFIQNKIDVATSLQYESATGLSVLSDFLKQFTTENLHPTVPYKGGVDIVMTCGNTDGFSKAMQCFSNEWVEGKDPIEEREGVILEDFVYMAPIQHIRPKGLNIVSVAMDDQGMLPNGPRGLRNILQNWDYKLGKRPHLLYTISIGQNPTGGTIDYQRREEIYAICQEFDVIIIEDEPYWYLQYSNRKLKPPPPSKSSGYEFLDSLMPSYLSIDTDGRVVRLDTFSKTIAPGCRLGWMTAQPKVIERITRITEATTAHPCGFVQAMVAELIIGPGGKPKALQDAKAWNMDGWVRWLEGLNGEYERRMKIMCDILEQRSSSSSILSVFSAESNLNDSAEIGSNEIQNWSIVESTQLFSFIRPTGGMFAWIEVLFESHPLFKSFDPERFSNALWVFLATAPHKVLLGPGSLFASSSELRKKKSWRFFRLCFAAAPIETLAAVTTRFCEGLSAFWEIKNAKQIEDMLKEIEDEELDMNIEGLGILNGAC